ncbi:bifunctional DNA primase/polymerase, partial [Streptosporangium algeriense]
MNNLQQTAHQLHDAGLCVLPAAANGTKRPAIPWKHFQTERPTPEQLTAWFQDGTHHGLGVITGAVSGNLEMLELEGRAVHAGMPAEITALADASGLGDLWRRVTAGYLEFTPSGGIHLLYKVDGPVAGNTKLARRPGPADEHGRPTIEVLAETRGEGGWVVVHPSAGPVHPSGGAWTLVAGGPTTITTVTADERDALHHLLGAFDRMPHPGDPPPAPPA